MKKHQLFFLLNLFLILACETTKKPMLYSKIPRSSESVPKVSLPQPTKPPQIFFSGRTNADLILDSVLNLSLPPFRLPDQTKVSIGSLDAFRDGEFQEYPAKYNTINTLIEDALTMKISAERDLLVEKDLYTLARLFMGHDQYYPNPLVPHGAAGLDEFEHLKPIDYVLSFRVLECGVRYVPLEKKLHGLYEMVNRVALTKIHLRLINARTGVIKWSDMLTGTSEEKTPRKYVSLAENGQYRFYHYAYPARTGEVVKSNDLFPPMAERKPEEKKSLLEKARGLIDN